MSPLEAGFVVGANFSYRDIRFDSTITIDTNTIDRAEGQREREREKVIAIMTRSPPHLVSQFVSLLPRFFLVLSDFSPSRSRHIVALAAERVRWNYQRSGREVVWMQDQKIGT